MINERQRDLLKIIVEDYIKTARPVGSKAICDLLKCSSATVRNEMSTLEELGLLEKTHTSSGRVPSEKGYRYYVDHIMKPKELTGEDIINLQTIFDNQSLALNDVIIRSMEIVSDLTHYTSIVLGGISYCFPSYVILFMIYLFFLYTSDVPSVKVTVPSATFATPTRISLAKLILKLIFESTPLNVSKINLASTSHAL